MSKCLLSKQTYPFTWLEEVVEVTLNPDQTNIAQLPAAQIELIRSQLKTENRNILYSLKTQTFFLCSQKKQKILLRQYARALEFLKDQAMVNFSAYPGNSPLFETGERIIMELEQLQNQLVKRYGRHISDEDGKDRMLRSKNSSAGFKVLCKLSVDQMGLILKAADDTRLIMSRSISLVFRSIVPFLSTSQKKDISWNSMRSSTYHPEEADKAIAIDALEKLIRKIREYK
ncbi:hypothetical protein [Mucilaginibacter sp.]|uniref:hypothetical protein n=1 Tax=Mucilaginibacter sp. TaxID=1882438 RepID=UPI002635779D|nr:hypothetical protein [Mucilaginibacter sp.]MDB4921835.1 hypothetical protein [Mucilaginibacter sp.]